MTFPMRFWRSRSLRHFYDGEPRVRRHRRARPDPGPPRTPGRARDRQRPADRRPRRRPPPARRPRARRRRRPRRRPRGRGLGLAPSTCWARRSPPARARSPRKSCRSVPSTAWASSLETTPGLVVTVHSGEGKGPAIPAAQLQPRPRHRHRQLRRRHAGEPLHTNTHGQGYSELELQMLPEMFNGLDYTKGPYYASVGDFGAVASTHVKMANEIPNQMSLSAGTLGVYNGFIGGAYHIDDQDRIVGGFYLGIVDGPFTHPDNFRKIDGVIRYSHGEPDDGYDLTAMYYKGQGNLTTDQPLRAIQEGLIGRFGTLDPSDGSGSERFSLSGHYAARGDDWTFTSSAYAIRWRMFLYNDFTHFLDDPVNGDPQERRERGPRHLRQPDGVPLPARLRRHHHRHRRRPAGPLRRRLCRPPSYRRPTGPRLLRDRASHRTGRPCAGRGRRLQRRPSPSAGEPGPLHREHPQMDPVAAHHRGPPRRGTIRHRTTASSPATRSPARPGDPFSSPRARVVLGPWEEDRILPERRPPASLRRRVRRVRHRCPIRGPAGSPPGRTPFLAPGHRRGGGHPRTKHQSPRSQFATGGLPERTSKLELAYDADAGQDGPPAPPPPRGSVEFSGPVPSAAWLGAEHRPGLLQGALPRRPGELRPRRAVHRQRPDLHRLLRGAGGQPRAVVRRRAMAQARALSDQRR